MLAPQARTNIWVNVEEFPGLAGYVARGEARPAYERAFAAQWAFNNPGCSG